MIQLAYLQYMHQNIINHINSKQVQYNRTDHHTKSHTHEHKDIRWKPNVGENHLLQVISIFFLIRKSFYNIFVLVQSYTSRQASTCRDLQPSLVLQSFLEGSYNPHSSCTSRSIY